MIPTLSEQNQNPWVLAIRPKTLAAGASPVLIGLSLSHFLGSSDGTIAVLCLLGSLLLQIESNLVNDYFDWKKGSDTTERLGPIRVTSSGLLSPSQVKRAIFFVGLLSVGLGSVLVWKAGWPILVIGLLGLTCAFLYTAGPYPLAHLGLGDVFAFVFFGPVAVMGTVFALTGHWYNTAFWLGTTTGFFSVALLLVNNIRDVHEDQKTQKRTLVVRLGETKARRLYQTVLKAPYYIVGIGCLTQRFPVTTALVLLSAPFAYQNLKLAATLQGRDLNLLLEKTGRLLFIFSVLLSLGWWLKP